MPRLVGVDLGLDVLLLGRNLGGAEALTAGLVHAVVEPGEEIAAAEAWLLSDTAHASQPWDTPGATPVAHADYAPALARERARELARMLGHEPAPLAILDCVEFGLMQPFDCAIRAEMAVFARLIQRPEPRNMIRTMFLGRQATERVRRSSGLSPPVLGAVDAATALVRDAVEAEPALVRAGFLGGMTMHTPVQPTIAPDYWFRSQPQLVRAVRDLALRLQGPVSPLLDDECLLADFLVCEAGTIPAYLGGISGLISAAA